MMKQSLALLTDLYQLTMAYAYWKSGTQDKEAVFHLYFRENPFHGGYAICCGLQVAIDYLNQFAFSDDDITYLATLNGNDGTPLFETKFLDYLRDMRFSCDIAAIEEGTVVFANEPLLRVQGPILQGQLLETPMLNIINFQTLAATKAARVVQAAEGDPVLEFGLRRAQGYDGAVMASRAAYIGGCAATSNVLAGKMFGIPVKGTHAHSWVMSFDDEMRSFQEWAKAMPHNSIFLVDTYNTMEGIKNAIAAGEWLREQGKTFGGIRLDSGDLAYFSKEARKLMDDAGFGNAVIVGSNNLDENIIASLKDQGAKIGVWGVGTKLTTCQDQPALGGIYKLSAIKRSDGVWEDRIKLSESQAKISPPGVLQVRRYFNDKENVGDAIFDIQSTPAEKCVITDPTDMTRRKLMTAELQSEDLLIDIFQKGKCVYKSPAIEQIRAHTFESLSRFNPSVKRLVNPHQYPVGLEQSLFDHKTDLILKARAAYNRTDERIR